MINSRPETSLPTPARSDRWQPLRSGVLNLYRYDYEEFHFHDGRLLLRGNNGSGKSRVLALQLPFLLDGEVSPARIEPDGDQAKRIEWNLLMGKYPDRTGYTWIEFGRRDANGEPQFFTLGCGLRAVAGRPGLHSRWFFATTQRIGRDLFLQNAQRAPLGRDKLEAAIGSAGRVILKVDEYRRMVDERLFGLGPRYGALLELLLRLRRPQLSRKLDEEELSGALSDALPTLPPAIIDEVAESFSSLQTDRGMLREFVAAQQSVATFLDEYTVYMRMAVRRRSNAVRSTHAAYEAAQRALRDAERRFATTEAELEHLRQRQTDLATRLAGAESTAATLRESPEMRTADEVRAAGEAATAAERQFRRIESDEAAAAAADRRARESRERAEADARQLADELRHQLAAADSAANAADFTKEHRAHLRSPEAELSDFQLAATAPAALQQVIERRERSIAVLRTLEEKVKAARAALDEAEREQNRAEAEIRAAMETEQAAREGLSAAAAALWQQYVAWPATATHLAPLDPEPLADAFAQWTEQRQGASPPRRALDDIYRKLLANFAERESALTVARRGSLAEIAAIDSDIDRLLKGITPPPPPPPLRQTTREGRAGAPFWQLFDFKDALTEQEKAGIEAALQAAGLLDAWVMPDGAMLGDALDAFAVSIGTDSAKPSRHLGEALAVTLTGDAAQGGFEEAALQALLARVGLGEGDGPCWVAPSGRWRAGPVEGRASKPGADFIGEGTRAENRRRRIDELRRRRAAAEDALSRTLREFGVLAADRAAAAAELAAAPVDEPVLRGGFALEAAARELALAFDVSERAAQQSSRRRAAWEEAVVLQLGDARDLQLETWIGRLDELIQATGGYRSALAALWPTSRHWATVSAQLISSRLRAEEAAAHLLDLGARRAGAAREAESTRQRFNTLQETHGEAIEVILRKLDAAEASVREIKEQSATNQQRQIEQAAAHARADADRSAAAERQAGQDASRRNAIASLARFAEERLFAEADPSLQDLASGAWSVAQAVDIVRHRLDPLLADVADDDAGWARRQDGIHGHIQELRDRLIAHGHQPESHQFEDIVRVQCLFQARPHTMSELRAAFAGEIAERERLLHAKEQEIIENHLLAEAAVELTKLIRDAETWRNSANDELSSRPTSSGVRFRFQWEPDTAIRFHEIRPVLLRRGELWTAAERSALAAFLQGRIAAEQNADETGSWRDHLSRALDYRRWHRFVVERQQDGQWRRLNRSTYGTGSGGEKALALTLPRFAAAAAHYRGAAKTAPRLVMLDEAFAGIDPTMRAQCLGVLTQFDLDFVMTSELEWGCYRTVPSLAIYHLTTLPGLDAVAATRWLWNGRERRQEDVVLPPDAPAADPSPQNSESAAETFLPIDEPGR